jgi:hypothetical protein
MCHVRTSVEGHSAILANRLRVPRRGRWHNNKAIPRGARLAIDRPDRFGRASVIHAAGITAVPEYLLYLMIMLMMQHGHGW